MARGKAKGLGVVIATRRLRVASKGRSTVVVRLGMPQRRTATEWGCAFQVSGLGSSKVQYGIGIDAFQALLIGLGGIYRSLNEAKVAVTWRYEEAGGTGFVPIMPHFLGRRFFRKVERMAVDQIAEWAKAERRKDRRAAEKRTRKR